MGFDWRTVGMFLSALAAPISAARADEPKAPAVETATFALGWFWGPDARFGQLKGVVRTRVGYAGGKKDAPTYRSMGDHTETFQVDFDPKAISYERLLEIFWEEHDPYARAYSTQYKAAVFFHDERQKEAALRTRAALEKGGRAVTTEVLAFERFFRAEDYHQKYYLRSSRALAKELSLRFPGDRELVDSTAAARLNAFVSGYGTAEEVKEELKSLGFEPDAVERIAASCGRK